MHGVTTGRGADGIPSQGHQVTNAPSTQFEGEPQAVAAQSPTASYKLTARLVTWQLYGGGVGSGQAGVANVDANGHADEILIPVAGGGQTSFDFEGLETGLRL